MTTRLSLRKPIFRWVFATLGALVAVISMRFLEEVRPSIVLVASSVALLLMADAVAHAAVLCSSTLGHLRLRESCRRHETQVDVASLVGGAESGSVPLENWPVAERAARPDGLESAASVSQSTLVSLNPCRLIDTRPGRSSEFVGDDIGSFEDQERRTYTLAGLCNVPPEAKALSINLAIVSGPLGGFATVGPAGSVPAWPPGPSFASINFSASSVVSNSLIVPLDGSGAIDVYAARSADVIIDTNGYFQSPEVGTNTFFVAGTGTPAKNGEALFAAIAEANALPLGTPSSVELGPGTFDVSEGDGLSITRPVALSGAGQTLTKIVCDCEDVILLNGITGASVEDLALENLGALANDLGIHAFFAPQTVLRRLVVTSTGGVGIRLSNSTGSLLVDVAVDAAAHHGVMVTGAASDHATVRNSDIRGGKDGVYCVTASVTIEDSTLETDNIIEGPVSTTSNGVAFVRGSTLIAPATYADGSTGTITITHSFVDAGTIDYGGTASCTATTTPGAFHATGCP